MIEKPAYSQDKTTPPNWTCREIFEVFFWKISSKLHERVNVPVWKWLKSETLLLTSLTQKCLLRIYYDIEQKEKIDRCFWHLQTGYDSAKNLRPWLPNIRILGKIKIFIFISVYFCKLNGKKMRVNVQDHLICKQIYVWKWQYTFISVEIKVQLPLSTPWNHMTDWRESPSHS